MTRIIILVFAISLLCSCATHHGSISSSSINRNVKYEDIAFGVSHSKNILGFGGFSPDAIIMEGKRQLIRNRPLKPNEEYANFTVDFKRKIFIIYNHTKLTISADVVRFVNDTVSNPYSEVYKNKLSGTDVSWELFTIGDSVIFDKNDEGILISIVDSKNSTILFKTKNGNIKTLKVPTEDIYTRLKSCKGFKVGTKCTFYTTNNDGEMDGFTATIIGLGIKRIMVKDIKNNLLFLNYDQITGQ